MKLLHPYSSTLADFFLHWTRRLTVQAILLTLALAVLTNLTACSETTLKFNAIDVTGANFAEALNADSQMLDLSGKAATLAQWRGKVVVLFFGYTNCPDACPTTLAEVAQAKELLGAEGAKVQAVFVTLDPDRDTPEILQPYVTSFGTDFVALRGTPEKTAQLAKAFKVYYTVVAGKSKDNYTLDHSTGSYVIDPQGRVRLYTRYGSGGKALAEDIALLLKSS